MKPLSHLRRLHRVNYQQPCENSSVAAALVRRLLEK
jgi:hypothetical protein